MLKAILIDDEPKSINATKSIIEQIPPEVELIGTYTDPLEGLEAVKSTPFDLLLLDIDMPGLSGLELLNQVTEKNFEVIFVTAYKEYAIDALKLSALDYVLKPVSPSKLTASLQEAMNQIFKKRAINERLNILNDLLEEREKENKLKSQEKRIVFSSHHDISYVQIKDIIRIEGAKNYAHFHLIDGKEKVISKNIGFYDSLCSRFNFMKIHRSHIINLYHVSRYLREGYVEMSDESRVQCAVSAKEELLDRLKNLY